MNVLVILQWNVWCALAVLVAAALYAVVTVYRRELDHTPTPPPEAQVTEPGFYLLALPETEDNPT